MERLSRTLSRPPPPPPATVRGGGGGGGGAAGGSVPSTPQPLPTAAPPPPLSGEHEQRLYHLHVRMESERARHAGLATELRYFAKAMDLEAPPDDLGGDVYSPAKWVPPRARKVAVNTPVRLPLNSKVRLNLSRRL